MRYLIHSVRYLFCFLAISGLIRAQVIDRMMAVVNNHIITLSDVNRERLIRQVLGDKGPSNDKAILNDLIDAQITDDEITREASVDVPEADVDKELSRISDYRGLSAPIVRDAVCRRLRADQFFNVRFRQLIGVSDDEIQQYYQNVFVPEAQKRGTVPIPALDQVSEMIRNNVVEEKTIQQVENWLATSRQRSEVEIFP